MNDLSQHPAVRLGRWLKLARMAKGLVKRVFAGQILLTPSRYSEVEAGVSTWIKNPQESAIIDVLDLASEKLEQFMKLLNEARKAFQLSFSNLFTREQLEPVRCRHFNNLITPSEIDKEAILNAVFCEVA
jgi:transcriptional regulator with XRE-family HTH domain